MCSINFVHRAATPRKVVGEIVERMCAVSRHRGPDAIGFHIEDDVGLGMNRLEIVGGPQGRQPIYAEDNRTVLICNGEIYNHGELRHRFFQGKRFQTTSDCEVILHLYGRFGTRCVDYLEGQFAFIILDKRKKSVFFARDPYGIHPLFYCVRPGVFLAASTIRSLFSSGEFGKSALDPYGVAECLFFYGPMAPRTCFRKVHQLPPGSMGIYDLSSHALKIERWWTFTSGQQLREKNENLSKQLRDLVRQSVTCRLQGASRPGVYMSGGVDSAIIASCARSLTHNSPIAFGIAFDDPALDEGAHQRTVAEILKIPLVQLTVAPADIAKHLKVCTIHAETPLIRSAPVPLFLLSEVVRKHGVKFVLCGEGADELLGGYPVFGRGKASFEEKWEENSAFLGWFRHADVREHLQDAFRHMVSARVSDDTLKNAQFKEIDTKLSRYLLANQGDRMSLAHSVEQRFPYLDRRVTRFAMQLNTDALFEDGESKAVLRNAFRDTLPSSIISRKKQGYLAPDARVMHSVRQVADLQHYLEKDVTDQTGIYSWEHVRNIRNRLRTKGVLTNGQARMLLVVLTTHLLAVGFQSFDARS